MLFWNLQQNLSWSHIWSMQIMGIDLYHIFSWFFIFSFFGWVWETTLVSVRSHKYVNRGFITGPLCTIYGTGAVSVYLLLVPFSSSYVAIFFVGMLVATALEYVTSAVMERLFHAKWWDYSSHRFQVKGRICLGVSIGWGFMSLALYLFFMPLADWIMSLYPRLAGEIGICVGAILYGIDFAFACAAACNLESKIRNLRESLEEARQKLKDSRAYGILENALDDIAEQREELGHLKILQKLEEHKAEWVRRQDRVSKRFLNAYPVLTANLLERKEEFEKKKEEIKSKVEEEIKRRV